MRPIEDIDLERIDIPKVSTDAHVFVARKDSGGKLDVLDDRVEERTPVINEDMNRVIAIHGSQYKLFSNRDFMKVVRSITGEQFKGYVNSEERRLDVYYYPEDYTVDINNAEEGDRLRLGFRFTNSYDGSSAVRVRMIGQRLKCKNGIIVPESIGEVSTRHTKNSIEADDLKDIVGNMYDSDLEMLTEIMHDAKRTYIDDPIKWIQAFSFKENLPANLKNSILERVIKNNNESISRYRLWNMFTRAITHGYNSKGTNDAVGLSETYLERLHKKANKIFTVREDEIQDTIDMLTEKEMIDDNMQELKENISVVAER